jgi:Ulp1 family protease
MQNNCCDCGVFALQYAQEVLQRSPDILPDDLRRGTVEGFGPHMFSIDDMHVSRSV